MSGRWTWKIRHEIGEGGFGKVYTVRRSGTRDQAVLKVALRSSGNEGIRNELRIYQRLRERRAEGFPKVLDRMTENGKEMIIMEALGEDLDTMVHRRRGRVLDEVKTADIGYQLLKALKGLHDAGFVHRDLKPDNVLLGLKDPDSVYLIDLGIAKSFKDSRGHVERGRDQGIVSATIFGPRVAHRTVNQSRKDDLESLVYTLAYLYRGHLPWSSTQGSANILRLKEEFPRSSFFRKLPKALQRIWEHSNSLSFKQRPDYQYLFHHLNRMGQSQYKRRHQRHGRH